MGSGSLLTIFFLTKKTPVRLVLASHPLTNIISKKIARTGG